MASLSHAVVEIYRLHDVTDWHLVMPDILHKLGAAIGAQRVALFQTITDDQDVVTATEIMAYSVDRRKPTFYHLALRDAGLGDLLDTLNRGNIYLFDVNRLLAERNIHFFPAHVQHILMVPMFVNNRLWGFVRFDDTRENTSWTAAQQNIIRAAVGQMATAIERIERPVDRQQHEHQLARLYGIMEQADLTIEERIHALLETGLEELSLDTAIVSHIDDDLYVVRYLAPEIAGIAEGQIFERGLTYCDITLNQGKTVAIHHAQTSEHNRHPAYQQFKLEAYIGSLLTLNNKPYGTVNFSGVKPHAIFTPTDLAFVNEISRLVTQLLEG
ncbi:MAG: GAF domain-containing protein [Anaerolineae bacterium]|nr:GAF domain-containing protein [Anaerolineae bacterium]